MNLLHRINAAAELRMLTEVGNELRAVPRPAVALSTEPSLSSDEIDRLAAAMAAALTEES